MQVYVINLDRSTDRLAHMSRELEAAGVKFTRFPAVNGAEAAPEAGQETMPPGHLGCVRSHQAIWRLIMDSPDEWGAVLEDDAYISPSLGAFLEELDRNRITDADIIKLETIGARIRVAAPRHTLAGFDLRPLLSKHGGTAGYVLRRDYATTLLEKTRGFPYSIDFIFHPDRIPSLRVQQAVPALVIQMQCSNAPQVLPTTLEPFNDSKVEASRRLSRTSRIKSEIQKGLQRAKIYFSGQALIRVPFGKGDEGTRVNIQSR